MKIYIAADHAGFALKEVLVSFLKERGYSVVDKGADEYVEEDDYPEYIASVAAEVSKHPKSVKGIVLGGSGQGEAMMANRFAEVRAAVFNGQYVPVDGRNVPNEIILSREHNDANILSLGARFLNEDEAKRSVSLWLETPFSDDVRHKRRIAKIDKLAKAFYHPSHTEKFIGKTKNASKKVTAKKR